MRGLGRVQRMVRRLSDWILTRRAEARLPALLDADRRRLNAMLQTKTPRIAVVKQDAQEDLYCCESGASPREIVASTLMRTGPVELFRLLHADLLIVETEPDAECNVWQQKWTECRWCPLEWFEEFRSQVPGRSYGQSRFAVKASSIDWSRYHTVVSIDVSIPRRITQRYPEVVWCYCIREPKTSAYRTSLRTPLPGQDIFLNQCFRMVRPRLAAHEVEFPYYLQSHGCFHDLFSIPTAEEARRGVFLEHQTAGRLTRDQLRMLV